MTKRVLLDGPSGLFRISKPGYDVTVETDDEYFNMKESFDELETIVAAGVVYGKVDRSGGDIIQINHGYESPCVVTVFRQDPAIDNAFVLEDWDKVTIQVTQHLTPYYIDNIGTPPPGSEGEPEFYDADIHWDEIRIQEYYVADSTGTEDTYLSGKYYYWFYVVTPLQAAP